MRGHRLEAERLVSAGRVDDDGVSPAGRRLVSLSDDEGEGEGDAWRR